MILSEPVAVLSKKSKRNLDWLEDEFFDKSATRKQLLHVAEHYEDVAKTNTVADAEYRVECVRRAKYLRRLAAGLRTASPR